MDLKQLQEDWKKYKINQFLEKELKMPILFSYIVGSTILDLRDETSDVDIIIITSNNCSYGRLPYKFEYQGITIHGWYQSIWDNLTPLEDQFSGGSILDYKINKDWILDVSESAAAQKILDFFLKSSMDRSLLNFKLMVERYHQEIYSLNNQYFISFKFLYILIYWYMDIIKKEVDLDFIKRIKKHKITYNDKQQIFIYAKEIWNYYLKNSNSIQIIQYLLKKKDFLQEVLIDVN